jgi:hypothetical protein
MNILVFTSCFFLINTIICYYYEYYLYSALFFMLFVSSIIHHTYYTDYTYVFDKISIIMVVFYGGYIFFEKMAKLPISISSIIVVATFLSTIVLYYFGYISNQFCFDCNNDVAHIYHGLMHLLSCIGHICIVVL